MFFHGFPNWFLSGHRTSPIVAPTIFTPRRPLPWRRRLIGLRLLPLSTHPPNSILDSPRHSSSRTCFRRACWECLRSCVLLRLRHLHTRLSPPRLWYANLCGFKTLPLVLSRSTYSQWRALGGSRWRPGGHSTLCRVARHSRITGRFTARRCLSRLHLLLLHALRPCSHFISSTACDALLPCFAARRRSAFSVVAHPPRGERHARHTTLLPPHRSCGHASLITDRGSCLCIPRIATLAVRSRPALSASRYVTGSCTLNGLPNFGPASDRRHRILALRTYTRRAQTRQQSVANLARFRTNPVVQPYRSSRNSACIHPPPVWPHLLLFPTHATPSPLSPYRCARLRDTMR